MSLEKQMETLTQSINDLIGAVDANTQMVAALLEISGPGAVVTAVRKGMAKAGLERIEDAPVKEEPHEEPTAEETVVENAEVIYGMSDIKKAFIKLVEEHGREAMEEVLAAHGAKKLSDLSDKKYSDEKLGDVMADIQAKMGG